MLGEQFFNDKSTLASQFPRFWRLSSTAYQWSLGICLGLVWAARFGYFVKLTLTATQAGAFSPGSWLPAPISMTSILSNGTFLPSLRTHFHTCFSDFCLYRLTESCNIYDVTVIFSWLTPKSHLGLMRLESG